ncbi:hypothetical protein ACFL35_18780 [Candidatus Riflebacteria bacterium]
MPDEDENKPIKKKKKLSILGDILVSTGFQENWFEICSGILWVFFSILALLIYPMDTLKGLFGVIIVCFFISFLVLFLFKKIVSSKKKKRKTGA